RFFCRPAVEDEPFHGGRPYADAFRAGAQKGSGTVMAEFPTPSAHRLSQALEVENVHGLLLPAADLDVGVVTNADDERVGTVAQGVPHRLVRGEGDEIRRRRRRAVEEGG